MLKLTRLQFDDAATHVRRIKQLTRVTQEMRIEAHDAHTEYGVSFEISADQIRTRIEAELNEHRSALAALGIELVDCWMA